MRSALLLLLGCVAMTANAGLSLPGLESRTLDSANFEDKALARTGLGANVDDITAEQDENAVRLDEKRLHEARVWGLTEREEKRYVLLMQNRSGVYYRGLNMTPVDILGIHARTEDERQHFAELAARLEADKISRNLVWNNAFHRAYSRLYEHVPVVDKRFDPAPWGPATFKPVSLLEGDTLYLFVNPDDPVKTTLLTLIDAIEATTDTRLHLLVLNADDGAIRLWASRNQIPVTMVNGGRISLNHGELQYNGLQVDKKRTPLLLLARAGATTVVDLE